jgi:benzil reductase ((S)-benzoin forming)
VDYYYITGVSRGLGRALAYQLLERTDSVVIGLGRTSTIASPHFQHVQLDLTDLAAVSEFAFPPNRGARRLVLVDNAVAFTPKRLGRVHPRAIVHDYHVNLVAPTLLINSFIQAYWAHTAGDTGCPRRGGGPDRRSCARRARQTDRGAIGLAEMPLVGCQLMLGRGAV